MIKTPLLSCTCNRLLLAIRQTRYASTAKNDVVQPTSLDDLQNIESHKICLVRVQKYDRENFLAALCIKDKRIKRAVVALRAYNVELSLIRDSTTSEDRARLRFNFWSKLIDEIVSRNKREQNNVEKIKAYYDYTPVGKELLEIFYQIEVTDRVAQLLRDPIGARLSSKAFGTRPFDDLADLELYTSKSHSSIYNLMWILYMNMRSWFSAIDALEPHFTKTSDSLGKAHGLCNVIRGIRYNSTRNCCYVPNDILADHNLIVNDFLGPKIDGPKVAPAIKSLADACDKHLKVAFAEHKFLPKPCRPLFLPRVAIRLYLHRLSQCKYDITNDKLYKPSYILPFNLWLASKTHWAPIFY